jgi:hypothetical protein
MHTYLDFITFSKSWNHNKPTTNPLTEDLKLELRDLGA